MEIARSGTVVVRQATKADAGQITALLQVAAHTHSHADWHLLADWLGLPGFVICEGSQNSGAAAGLSACLAVAADPPPAAWVRLAAIRETNSQVPELAAMLDCVLPYLRGQGVTELAWLPSELWPDTWFLHLGFRRINWIVTFAKDGLDIPLRNRSRAKIRPATLADMPALAAIDQAAFSPIWQHSVEGLVLAYRHALLFDVGVSDGAIVGFQYSVRSKSRHSAHLVRITVSPDAQRRGVGSSLMAAAFDGFRSHGLRHITLNTQIDNVASHRLYEKFGFYRDGDQVPVWALPL